jgi:hypothetical protein
MNIRAGNVKNNIRPIPNMRGDNVANFHMAHAVGAVGVQSVVCRAFAYGNKAVENVIGIGGFVCLADCINSKRDGRERI